MGYADMRAFLRQNNSDNPNNIFLKAVKRYNKVLQVGLWQRSGVYWQNAIDGIELKYI